MTFPMMHYLPLYPLPENKYAPVKTLPSRNFVCAQTVYDKRSFGFTSRSSKDKFPEKSVKGAVNYCRNPANMANGPYCYREDNG